MVLDHVRWRTLAYDLSIQEDFNSWTVQHAAARAVLKYEVKWYLDGRAAVEVHDTMRGQEQSAFLDLGVRAVRKKNTVRKSVRNFVIVFKGYSH